MSLQCWKCKKPVARVDVWHGYDAEFRLVDVYSVFCHGERQRVTLSWADMVNANSIQLAWAFRPGPEQLESGKTKSNKES